MNFADYPITLPFETLAGAWSLVPFREPAETQMAGGNVRLRFRQGDRLKTLTWACRLTPAQFEAFEAFVSDMLVRGTARFWMPVWLGASYQIRLVQLRGGGGGLSYRANQRGLKVEVSATLLVFPPEMTPALPSITAVDPSIAGTGTVGATVQLDIGGVSRSAVATSGAWSVEIPALDDGRHLVRARYVGGPWCAPVDLVTPAPAGG
ncbi:MAG: hypothetical protein DI549_10780 [Ancylobacter novellus]|uniref:Bacterial Ig-like domain-containing protein n=1 Tax=Ancylobacter novellus TaxID=921 RepID=A0A2W5QZ50_ANCNO|nr:MAG: hypothetical protein DI549_10780 [Ancylobacter novellus]